MRLFLKHFTVVALYALVTTALEAQQNERIKLANQIYYTYPDSTLSLCNVALSDAEKTSNKIDLAAAKLCLGRYYLLKTNWEIAGKMLQEAEMLLSKQNNLKDLARCLSLKSILQDRIGNHQEGLEALSRANNIYREISDTAGLIGSLLNLSNRHIKLKLHENAKESLRELHSLYKHLSYSDKYYYHQNLGMYHYSTGNYKEALTAYEIALTYAETNNMIDSKATILMLCSMPLIELNRYTEAESKLKESASVSIENTLMHELQESYEMLVKLHEKKGDFKQAFEYQKKFNEIKDELYAIERINKINELEEQLKLAEKEKIISEKTLAIERNETKINILIILSTVFIVICGGVVWSYIKTKKLNTRIAEQNVKIQEKSQLIEEAYTNIRDSVEYSKHLQDAILPNEEKFKANFREHFILYLPKDIVSGDFYWIEEKNDTLFWALGDCTGHGVPGAMLSVIGHNSLNRCINDYAITEPHLILDKLVDVVSETFTNQVSELNDGMNIAVCSMKKGSNRIQYAGAMNPIWILRGEKITVLSTDKQPIGKFSSRIPFSLYEIKIEPGDTLYLFSDGYADQFGGPAGKKFKYKQFQELLTNTHHLPLQNQLNELEQTIKNWKANLEQTDDISILAIRF
ncbi:MAG: SpoIIE family protein phosphatase [Flavobacteriales bacterium]